MASIDRAKNCTGPRPGGVTVASFDRRTALNELKPSLKPDRLDGAGTLPLPHSRPELLVDNTIAHATFAAASLMVGCHDVARPADHAFADARHRYGRRRPRLTSRWWTALLGPTVTFSRTMV